MEQLPCQTPRKVFQTLTPAATRIFYAHRTFLLNRWIGLDKARGYGCEGSTAGNADGLLTAPFWASANEI